MYIIFFILTVIVIGILARLLRNLPHRPAVYDLPEPDLFDPVRKLEEEDRDPTVPGSTAWYAHQNMIE